MKKSLHFSSVVEVYFQKEIVLGLIFEGDLREEFGLSFYKVIAIEM